MELESKIVRGLALVALAVALLAAGYIAVNSGMIGGDSGAASEPESAPVVNSDGTPADATAAPGEQPATVATNSYVVQDGDSFSTIAKKYNVTIADIQKLNPTLDSQNLKPGTKLVVP
jgi:LysM repeat protein